MLKRSLGDFQKDCSSMENIRHSTAKFNIYKMTNFVILYFSMGTLGMSILAYEFDYWIYTDTEMTKEENEEMDKELKREKAYCRAAKDAAISALKTAAR